MSILSQIYRSLSSTLDKSVSFFSTTASSSSPAQREAAISEATQFVNNTIASNKIVVFSKSYCPYCRSTKQYFANKFPGETVHVVEINGRSDMRIIQTYLGEKTGETTVPRTFINGQSIGGNSDLQNMPLEKVTALIQKSAL